MGTGDRRVPTGTFEASFFSRTSQRDGLFSFVTAWNFSLDRKLREDRTYSSFMMTSSPGLSTGRCCQENVKLVNK